MRYILLPVKDLLHAKQRLAPLLTQAERTKLAWTMLEHTFRVAAQTTKIDGIAVVTLYPPAIELAEKLGMEVILEREQISESVSVDYGSQVLEQRGATAVLRLPLDLPLIQPEDIETILAADTAPTPSCVIVPSLDGTGTNAILRRQPTLFPSQFGNGSFAKHIALAKQKKAQCKVLEIPRIALDIDDKNDLKALLATENNSIIRQWLSERRIHQSLTDSNA